MHCANSARTRLVARCLSIVIVTCFLFTPLKSAIAQPLADRVPGDALIYVGWQGVDAVEQDYQGSNLQGVLSETQVHRLLGEVLPRILEERGQMLPPDIEQGRVAVSDVLLPTLWQRPWAFYMRAEASDQGSPQREMALVIEAGDRADAVESSLNELLALAQQYAGQPIPPTNIDRADGTVTVRMFGVPDEAANMLDASDRFAEARGQLADDGLGVFYLDMDRLFTLMLDTPHSPLKPAVLEALGLDGLEQIIASTGFDGERWQSELFVHAPSERRGLLSVLEGAPLDADFLNLVPRDVTWFGVGQFDLAALVDVIREASQAANPQAAGQFDDTLMMLSMQTGVDIEAELIDNLGSTWLMYNAPAAVGLSEMGGVVVNPLRDAAAVQTALTQIEQTINDMLAQQQLVALRWRTVTTEHAGMTIHTAALPLVSPSWAVHEDRLYLALLPQPLMTAAEGAEASVLDNPAFQEVRDRLALEEDATSLNYIDLERLAPMTYQSYVMLTQTLPAAAIALGADGPAVLLPSLSAIMPHLSPAVGGGWSSEAGLHWRSNEPFPGSSMLGQEALGGLLSNPALFQTAPVLLGGLSQWRYTTQPASTVEQHPARNTQSMTQMRQLTLAANLYIQDHEEQLSPTLAALLPYVNQDPALFRHPSQPPVPASFDQWSAQQQAEWLHENSAYIYVPRDVENIREIEQPSEAIILFERPRFARDDMINAGYLDGHVARERLADVRRSLQQQTGMTMEELIQRQINDEAE